jgi:hypothetical protein
LPGLSSNHDLPDLGLLSIWDYKRETPHHRHAWTCMHFWGSGGSTRGWIQGFMPARQVLCHLNHSASFFFLMLVIFEVGSRFMLGQAFNCCLPDLHFQSSWKHFGVVFYQRKQTMRFLCLSLIMTIGACLCAFALWDSSSCFETKNLLFLWSVFSLS